MFKRAMNLRGLWLLPCPFLPVVLVSMLLFAMFNRRGFPYISVWLKGIRLGFVASP